jgi:hypothetical protein
VNRARTEGLEWVPLPVGAARLGLTWRQAYDLALAGKLRTRRDGARWLVAESDLARLARERGRPQPAA